MSTTANSSSEFIVELLSEHGKRRAELGRGDDCKQAYQAYDKACRKYPHNGVRLRQGNQTIALSHRGPVCARAETLKLHWTVRAFNQAADLRIGFFVPGSVLTPMGQDSAPSSMAARSFRQNSSSCSRAESITSSASRIALFHLNMTLSPQLPAP